MSAKFEFDTTVWNRLVEHLGGENAQRAERAMIRAAAQRLYKQTESNIRSLFPNSTNRNPNYNDTIAEGLRMRIGKNTEYETEAIVHVMGTPKSGSQTYKLRFFEGGTKERIKGHSRGRIEPMNFFQSAVNQTNGEVQDIMRNELEKYLEKIHNGQ